MSDVMTIHTLGTFSARFGDAVISDNSPRSRKLWKIFKYLLTNRHKTVPTEALIDMLWPESDDLQNPVKSLHTLMSRLRKMISPNGEADQLIIYRQNGYRINMDAPISIDVTVFDNLIATAKAATDAGEKIRLLKEAVDLYAGDYLTELASETWVATVANYYKRQYLWAVSELMDLYERASSADDIISLCNIAIERDPYNESLYERLIQSLLINGEKAEAQKQYRQISSLMAKEFGVQPSEGLRALNQIIKDDSEGNPLDLNTIKDRLDGQDSKRGVYFCTSDMFRQIYQIDKRSDERINFPVFLALITIKAAKGKPFDDKSLKSAMRTLRQCFTRTLRNGEVVSQYSRSQYVMLLSAYAQKDVDAIFTRVRRMFASETAGAQCDVQTNVSLVGRGQDNVAGEK